VCRCVCKKWKGPFLLSTIEIPFIGLFSAILLKLLILISFKGNRLFFSPYAPYSPYFICWFLIYLLFVYQNHFMVVYLFEGTFLTLFILFGFELLSVRVYCVWVFAMEFQECSSNPPTIINVVIILLHCHTFQIEENFSNISLGISSYMLKSRHKLKC